LRESQESRDKRAQIRKEWLKAKQTQGYLDSDYTAWFNENWKTELDVQLSEESEAYGLWVSAITSAGAEAHIIARARKELDNEVNTVLIEDAFGTPTPYLRQYVDCDIARFLSESNETSFSLKKGLVDIEKSYSKWSAGGSASYGGFFWGVQAGGGVTEENWSESWIKDNKEVRVRFKNIKPFPIVRANWYNTGLVSKYGDRIPSADKYFTKKGLTLIPTRIVLVHGTKITVSANHEAGSFVRRLREEHGSVGIRIGPFSFGGSYSSTTDWSKTHVETTETGFTVEDVSGRPKIVALMAYRPYDEVF
jgi:hypothetical protein